MLSPGGGLGAQAAAINKIKSLHDQVIESIGQFPSGSREQQALLRVAQTLSLFTKQGPGGPGGAGAGPPGGVPPAISAMNMPGAPPGPPGMPPMPPPGGPEMPAGGPA